MLAVRKVRVCIQVRKTKYIAIGFGNCGLVVKYVGRILTNQLSLSKRQDTAGTKLSFSNRSIVPRLQNVIVAIYAISTLCGQNTLEILQFKALYFERKRLVGALENYQNGKWFGNQLCEKQLRELNKKRHRGDKLQSTINLKGARCKRRLNLFFVETKSKIRINRLNLEERRVKLNMRRKGKNCKQ